MRLRYGLMSGVMALALMGCGVANETPGSEAAPSSRALELTLAPVQAENSDAIETVELTYAFEGISVQAGEPLFRLPLIASNVDTVATVLENLIAEDDQGEIPLSFEDVDLPERSARDAVSGGPSRQWLAGRDTVGAVTVRYSVPADATLPPRGPAPPFGFSNKGEGVSAAGHIFVVLPPGEEPYDTIVNWDLSRAPDGARGFSSLGEGRVEAPRPMTGQELRMSFYMAGDLLSWPEPTPETGFFGVVQGEPPFDGQALLSWAGELYDDYSGFFGQEETPTYGVFIRYNPINGGGGVGLHHSFVLTYKEDSTNVAGLQSTLAHEMFHTFQPFIAEPGGLESSWFGEGLAVFYQARLPLRFGMLSPEEFLEDLNFHAGRYYTSLMATAPNSEVPARFWADTRIRTLPYDRGMLYFVTIDDAVREASQGERSLDDLMLEMLHRQQAGETLTNAVWEEVLQAELGADAVTGFRNFLDGAMPVPASDAFGPCFERTTRPMRRYELGFDTAVLAEPTRIIRGLEPGTAAAEAGLQNGDEIVRPVPQDALQGSQDALLTLEIRRGEETFEVTYLPRGETVDAYQWERVESVPASACGL
ncbi:peptidase M61 [Oceanicaulis sp. LC35]|uniref:peptidase M61 n=1 Tax=Oceanicaulis sp. LC35 TaxID=3349635 RepID=UPI003F860D43